MQQYTSHYEYNIKGKVKYCVPKMNNAMLKFNFYIVPYFVHILDVKLIQKCMNLDTSSMH